MSPDSSSRTSKPTEGRTAHAARTVGAWLKPLEASLRPEMEALDRALEALEALGLSAPGRPPRREARFDALVRLPDQRLRTPEGAFRADERLVVFTRMLTATWSCASAPSRN